MAEPPKKKRKAKAEATAAEAGGQAEATAAEAGGGGGEGIFGSVAELLSKGTSAPGEGKQEDGSELKVQYSRLFGSGGGLFGVGAQASQLPRTPSASSAAGPRSTPTPTTPAEAIASRKRGRSSEPATSSTAGKAADAKGEKGEKDRPGGKSGKAPRLGPLTPEEKQEVQSRLVFIGNVPLYWTEKMLRSAMREAVGDKYEGKMKPIWFRSEPLKVRWVFGKRQKDGHKMKDYAEGVSDAKHGYAEVDSPEAVRIVSKAIHGFKADDSHILRGDAVGEAAKLLKFDRKRSIFVGNLPASATEADLRQAFGKAGTIDAVRVVRDKDSKMCKGVAFVRFEKRTSVKAAFELWPWPEVKGRELRVSQVADQSEQGKAQAHRDWEMTPAAKRILLKEQRKLRSKVNKAVNKHKEAAKLAGKRPGTRTKGKRENGVKRGGKKGKKK